MNLISVRRRADSSEPWSGLLEFRGRVFPCALGRSGITTQKREGDGGTPAGTFRLLNGYYRKDRFTLPSTRLSMRAINAHDGWCDDPRSSVYNSAVQLPFAASHEKMMREDNLYDVCVVLDYNLRPRKRHAGSAIFFHMAKPGFKPTEGCVAIEPDVMRRMLPYLNKETVMRIIA